MAPPLRCESVMSLVPGGRYIVGAADGTKDQKPMRTVELSPYCIDRYEVTNERYYNAMVAIFRLTLTRYRFGEARLIYYDTSESALRTQYADKIRSTLIFKSTVDQVPFSELPSNDENVGRFPEFFTSPQLPKVDVTWAQADAFCKQVGGRLPTEVEWETAAHGPNNWDYPISTPRFMLGAANFNNHDVGLLPVGSFPPSLGFGGVSDLLYDLAGNAWEWTGDWYSEFAHSVAYMPGAVPKDPKGPKEGEKKVIKGGSWGSADPRELRASYRTSSAPNDVAPGIGFRCAKDPVQEGDYISEAARPVRK